MKNILLSCRPSECNRTTGMYFCKSVVTDFTEAQFTDEKHLRVRYVTWCARAYYRLYVRSLRIVTTTHSTILFDIFCSNPSLKRLFYKNVRRHSSLKSFTLSTIYSKYLSTAGQ